MRIIKYTVHEEQWLGTRLLPHEKSTAIINVRSANSSAISNTTARSTPAPNAHCHRACGRHPDRCRRNPDNQDGRNNHHVGMVLAPPLRMIKKPRFDKLKKEQNTQQGNRNNRRGRGRTNTNPTRRGASQPRRIRHQDYYQRPPRSPSPPDYDEMNYEDMSDLYGNGEQ